MSMMVKVAFYKGRGNWLNKIIRWWTKSKYSHVELVLPNSTTWIGISPFLSSRVESRCNIAHKPSNWDFVHLSITDNQYGAILDFFKETKGCKYDWIGMLLSQFLPFRVKRKDKWYCSEWIAYALRIAGIFNWQVIKIYDQCDLSPGMLYKLIMKQKRKDNETTSKQDVENQSNL